MAEVNALTKTVVQLLHDSAHGYSDIGDHLQSPVAKSFFAEEAARRQGFAEAIASKVGLTEDVGGTVAGSVHRAWGDLKAKLGGGDHTLLETAEQGEDAINKAYDEALKSDDLDGGVRDLLLRQQPSLRASREKVKQLASASQSE